MDICTIEEIKSTLESVGVKHKMVNIDKHGFSRTVAFSVYGIVYRIEWYKNVSNVMVYTGSRSARYPFRYIEVDRCFPLVGGNVSLCFSYDKEKFLGKEKCPYDSFRIPVEITTED